MFAQLITFKIISLLRFGSNFSKFFFISYCFNVVYPFLFPFLFVTFVPTAVLWDFTREHANTCDKNNNNNSRFQYKQCGIRITNQTTPQNKQDPTPPDGSDDPKQDSTPPDGSSSHPDTPAANGICSSEKDGSLQSKTGFENRIVANPDDPVTLVETIPSTQKENEEKKMEKGKKKQMVGMFEVVRIIFLINLFESVQRSFTKLFPGRIHLSYPKRLSLLWIYTLLNTAVFRCIYTEKSLVVSFDIIYPENLYR